MEVWKRMRMLREDAGLTQTEIADLLKTRQHQISKYERGIQEIPVRHVIALARFYNVSLDYICGLTMEKGTFPKK